MRHARKPRTSTRRLLVASCLPVVAALCFGTAACTASESTPSDTSPAETESDMSPDATPSDAGTVTDYTQEDNWMALPQSADLPVDVFYLYPTAFRRADEAASTIASVDDSGMREGAQSAFDRQATLFEGTANIYAPYYRQVDATYALALPADEHTEVISGAPTIDAAAAFEYFIENCNDGRPFILAGHSQGAEVTENLLSGYLSEHPDVYERMVAAYVIGYSVTPEFLAANPHLEFAEGADDTGVIISYNTEAPTIAAANPVVLPGAIAINPITWTRSEELAPASASLGSWLPDTQGVFGKVEHYADAQVDLERGVVIASTPDVSIWSPGGLGHFPAGVYHSYDYQFYYFDLQANAKLRVDTYLATNRS
jgi:pimeloyl-ACP methyl ester carboxylesterase